MRALMILLMLVLGLASGPLVADGDEDRVDRLIQQLSERSYKRRTQALEELLKLGVEAWPQIRKALASAKDLESKGRLSQLVAAICSKLARNIFKVERSLTKADRRSAAAVSPDGGQVVYFAGRKNCTFYRVDTETGRQSELVVLRETEDEPLASLLVYGGMNAAGQVSVMATVDEDNQENYRTGVLGLDGQLAWYSVEGGLYYPFLLSDDGKSALVGELTLSDGRPDLKGPSEIYRLDLSTNQKERIWSTARGGFTLHLTRSPDGKRLIILYKASRQKSQLVVIDLETRKELARSPDFGWDDVVFDDNLLMVSDQAGQRIYLTTQTGNQNRIKVFEVAKGQLIDVSGTPLILCGMLDEDYLSAYSPQKRQACLLHVGTGKLLWQPRGSPVLLGRAAKKAVFARLKAGTTLVRGWQGLSVGSVDRKILAQLKQCSR